MSGRAIALWLVAYYLAAFAFALLTGPRYVLWTVYLSSAAGAAVPIFVIAGLLPIIGWGFARFKAQSARPVLIVWAILEVAMMALTELGRNA